MPTILLVEDDADIRELLSELLRFRGYAIATAANGKEALDLLHESAPPAAILLDLMMPVMNGWEFRERQLSDPALAGIPVVAVSAIAAQANGMGCRAVLQKPVQLPALDSALSSCQLG